MKILICTQKVDIDDPILGFFHSWLIEFAKHFDSIIVICLEEGRHELPANMRVISLGKEKVKSLPSTVIEGQKANKPVIPAISPVIPAKAGIQGQAVDMDSGRSLPSAKAGGRNDKKESWNDKKSFQFTRRLQYASRFLSIIWRERKNYDLVFVHMNQVYVILGGLFWKLWHKRVGLWYTHRAVHFQLRLAAFLADEIFTAAPESFGLKTKKLHILGHGIDIERFTRETHHAREGHCQQDEYRENQQGGTVLNEHDAPLSGSHQSPRIVSIGRITRIKHLETLIKAVELLRRESIEAHCTIVGSPVTPDDSSYFNELQSSVKSKSLQDAVSFKPAVPQSEIAAYYHDNDLNVNLTPTGGIDKVVLEGMAAGCLPLVSNEAFKSIFGQYSNKLIFKFQNASDLADKIEALWHGNRRPIAAYLFERVRADFDVRTVVRKISDIMLG